MAGVALAQASPGPNMMAVASLSLGSGRSAGLLAVAGIATGVLFWALLFAFGAGALFDAFPGLITAMKLIGGGYLLYLAWRSLRSALTSGRGGEAAIGGKLVTPFRAYLTGAVVVLTNPKAALMWVAIALYVASSGASAADYLLIGALAAASALAIYGSYAVLFSTGIAVRAYRRTFRWVEGLFGAVFGALGGRLAVDGVADLVRQVR